MYKGRQWHRGSGREGREGKGKGRKGRDGGMAGRKRQAWGRQAGVGGGRGRGG